MRPQNTNQDRNSTLKKVIIITLIAMLLLVLSFHILLPLLGITIAISANLWGIAIATILIMCALTLLLFVFTGIAVFMVGLFASLFAVFAIILFPLLFPILVPLLLLLLVIIYAIRQKKA